MNDRAKALEEQASELKRQGDFFAAYVTRSELDRLYQESQVDEAERARNLSLIAFLAVQVEEQTEAERTARESLALYRGVAEPDQGKLALYTMILACVLAEAGKFDEAIAIGEEAIRIYAAVYGADDEFVLDRKAAIQRMREGDRRSYLERFF